QQPRPSRPPAPDVNGHLGRIRAGDQIRRAEQVEKLVARKPAASPDDLILHHRDVRRRAPERDHAQLEKEERKLFERSLRSPSLRRLRIGCFRYDQDPLDFKNVTTCGASCLSRLVTAPQAQGGAKQGVPLFLPDHLMLVLHPRAPLDIAPLLGQSYQKFPRSWLY